MKCQKIEKWIPRLAGNELPAKKAARVKAHFEKCAGCRKEAAEFEAALKAARALARADEPLDWSEAEWRHLLRNVTAAKIEKKKAWAGWPLKPALAGALLLLLIAAGTFLLLKKAPVQPDIQAALKTPAVSAAKPAPQPGKQEVQSMTIVSKETGLKIIWFFNKNFVWEDYGK